MPTLVLITYNCKWCLFVPNSEVFSNMYVTKDLLLCFLRSLGRECCWTREKLWVSKQLEGLAWGEGGGTEAKETPLLDIKGTGYHW